MKVADHTRNDVQARWSRWRVTAVLCALLTQLILLASWNVLGSQPDFTWAAYRSPGFVVYVPAGSDVADLGPALEDLYASVSHIWLPNLIAGDGATPADLAFHACSEGSNSETSEPFQIAEREPGTCVPFVTSLFLYPSVDALQWDLRNYASAGVFGPTSTYDSTAAMAFQRTCARIPLEEACGQVFTVVYAEVGGFPDGSWKSALAHEFTHLLQTTGRVDLSDLPIDPHLILEGMAVVTQYRLGLLDSFQTHALEPIAHWIQSGGSYDSVPHYLLYEAGTVLVTALCEQIGPPALWELFSPLGVAQNAEQFGFEASDFAPVSSGVQTPSTGVSNWTSFAAAPFVDRLATLTGLDWNVFMDNLINDLQHTNVSDAGLAVYEWDRQQINLRQRLLEPVLCSETLAELGRLADRISGNNGTLADVDRADALLREPLCNVTKLAANEIAWRIPSLEDEVRRVQGDEAVQSVIRLGTTRSQHLDEPEVFVEPFADIVNNMLPWPQ